MTSFDPRRMIAAVLCLVLSSGAAALPVEGPLPAAKPASEQTPDRPPEKRPENPDKAGQPDASGEKVAPEKTGKSEKKIDSGKKPDSEATDKPEPAQDATPKGEDATPKAGAEGEKPEAGGEKPESDGEKPETGKPDSLPLPKPVEPVLTIAPEDGAAYDLCLAELKAIGAVFQPVPRIDDGKGCGIDRPIVVTKILPGITLKPEGTLRCATALALARWTRDSVMPVAAVAAPDAGAIVALNQASTYICRLRNNAETGKISEHARGNAVDIASFSFEKGEAIAIKPRREDTTLSGAFQRTVSASACLYFSTVLDPESDAAHETHLHLDVMPRKGGYRYCR